MVKKTLDERIGLALEAHRAGFNCAQSVVAAFADIPGMPDAAVMAKMMAPMGGGIGGQGMICGALTAAIVTDGIIAPDGTPKAESYRRARELTDRFSAPHNGSCLCRELKGQMKVPCDSLIASAVELLHQRVEGL